MVNLEELMREVEVEMFAAHRKTHDAFLRGDCAEHLASYDEAKAHGAQEALRELRWRLSREDGRPTTRRAR